MAGLGCGTTWEHTRCLLVAKNTAKVLTATYTVYVSMVPNYTEAFNYQGAFSVENTS